MLIITLAEMFNFPFSNAFAMNRAPRGKEGLYMGFYTMTFSAAHIVSAKAGMAISYRWDYSTNWLFMGCMGIIACILLVYTRRLTLRETN